MTLSSRASIADLRVGVRISMSQHRDTELIEYRRRSISRRQISIADIILVRRKNGVFYINAAAA